MSRARYEGAVRYVRPRWLRRLKAKPEYIATEMVNLTPESVGKFLETYGRRLAFCSHGPQPSSLPPYMVVSPDALAAAPPGVINPETMDARESDPETGESIPGTRRELKKWKSPIVDAKTKMPRKAYDWLKTIRKGREDAEKHSEEVALLNWAELLRGMWTPRKSAKACQAIEQIFAAERLSVRSKKQVGVACSKVPEAGFYTITDKHGNTMSGQGLHGSHEVGMVIRRTEKELLPEPSAIQITPRGFALKSRDLFDTLAWTILDASRRGFLRRCKNRCSAPLFVTTAKRPGQDYCYKCGGIEADRRRKREWASKQRRRKA